MDPAKSDDYGNELEIEPAEINPEEEQLDLFDDPLEEEVVTPPADDKEEREKDIRIPKARFDQAVQKERDRAAALQAQLDAIQKQQVAQNSDTQLGAAEAKLAELQDAYEDALLEGDKEGARAARTQANQLRDQIYDYKAQLAAHNARSSAVQDVEFKDMVDTVEESYPVLNPDSDDYDQDVTDEVMEMMDAFVKAGKSRAASLARAVGYVLGRAEAAAPAAPVLTREDMAKAARLKAIAAAKRQPPSTVKTGLDNGNGELDVRTLTVAKFDKLSDDEKARLRGDLL